MKDLIGKFQHAGNTMWNWYIHTQARTEFETKAEYKKDKGTCFTKNSEALLKYISKTSTLLSDGDVTKIFGLLA